jgi:hypothetical protein
MNFNFQKYPATFLAGLIGLIFGAAVAALVITVFTLVGCFLGWRGALAVTKSYSWTKWPKTDEWHSLWDVGIHVVLVFLDFRNYPQLRSSYRIRAFCNLLFLWYSLKIYNQVYQMAKILMFLSRIRP